MISLLCIKSGKGTLQHLLIHPANTSRVGATRTTVVSTQLTACYVLEKDVWERWDLVQAAEVLEGRRK